jgi:hypothetical protein
MLNGFAFSGTMVVRGSRARDGGMGKCAQRIFPYLHQESTIDARERCDVEEALRASSTSHLSLASAACGA